MTGCVEQSRQNSQNTCSEEHGPPSPRDGRSQPISIRWPGASGRRTGKVSETGTAPIDVPCFKITKGRKGRPSVQRASHDRGMSLATVGCRDFSTRPWKYQRPPSDHTPLGGVVRLVPGCVRRALSCFVCRLQFGQVHCEVEHDLDWLRVFVGIIVAVHIDFHLATIAHDTLATMLERHLHMLAWRRSDIVPDHFLRPVAKQRSRVEKADASQRGCRQRARIETGIGKPEIQFAKKTRKALKTKRVKT